MDGPHEQRELDPFDRLNQAMGVGEVTNPYPALAALRARYDIVPPGAEDTDIARLGPTMAPPMHVAVSYDAVSEILRDDRRFSSATFGKRLEQAIGPNIIEMDGPEHHAYRNLIQHAFGRRAMQRWEPEVVPARRRRAA